MKLDKLVDCIENLKKRMGAHDDILKRSELQTRVALIDPVLNALYWNVADPNQVKCEHPVDPAKEAQNKADYVLTQPNNGKYIAVIEAKKLGTLGTQPQMEHLKQIDFYGSALGTIFMGLTDGMVWLLYKRVSHVGLRDLPPILNVNLKSESSYKCALKLLSLWRPNLETGDPVKAGEPMLIKPQSELTIPPASLPQAIPPDPNSWVPISNFEAQSNSNPPQIVRFWDESELPIVNWKEILVCVIKKLYETERLTDGDIPITLAPGNKRYIVHTEPIHANGNKFNQPKEIAGTPLVVETNHSARDCIKTSKLLLQKYNVDHNTVHLKVK